MKFINSVKFSVFLFILLFSAADSYSQDKADKKAVSATEIEKPVQEVEAEKNTPALPPMQEGERLTFMQKDEAVERSQPESGSLLLKTLGAMCLIIGLIFFGAWGLKKLGFGGVGSNSSKDDSPELVILSSVSPKNGQTISVVKFGERTLLVGSTAQSFTLLAEDASFQEEFAPENFETAPRSVAEMLAEEETSFGDELEKAENRMTFPNIFGGQI